MLDKTKRICGVYQILNTANNKRYIGSSVYIYKRFNQHLNTLRQNKHQNRFLQRAWNKYGADSFKFQILLICSMENLDFYEELIIKEFQTNDAQFGYNLRPGARSNKGLKGIKRIDSIRVGETHNRLTFIKPIDRFTKSGTQYWLCQCMCGNIKEINSADVRHNHTKSCGCLNTEKLIERITDWNKSGKGPWNKKEINDNLYVRA